MRFLFIERRRYILVIGTGGQAVRRKFKQEEIVMKVWSKPAVREVPSYMPAEIDII